MKIIKTWNLHVLSLISISSINKKYLLTKSCLAEQEIKKYLASSQFARTSQPNKPNIPLTIGPLHDLVTWCGINYAETEVTCTPQDFQSKGTHNSPAWLSFVSKVPLHSCVPAQFIPYHVTRFCKGPIQRLPQPNPQAQLFPPKGEGTFVWKDRGRS